MVKASPRAQQQRRVVFFLGAGASVAVGAYATVQAGGHLASPTQDAFWSTFLKLSRGANNRRVIESFLFRYFLAYRRTPARLSPSERRKMLDRINVEEVFTFLSERIAAPATSAQLRTSAQTVWLALIEEVQNVFKRFTSNRATRRIYLKFMEAHVRAWDTIVSFNYDTIFEDSVKRDYTLFYDGVQQRGQWQHRVIKPHGSINWGVMDGRVYVTSRPNPCVVVAPTHLKFVGTHSEDVDGAGYLNLYPEMSTVWRSMETQMREAKALVFIGYSFPVADLYFSSVLRSVLATRDGQPRIVLVNPDAVAIRKRLEERFSLERIVTYFDLNQFMESSRNAILA